MAFSYPLETELPCDVSFSELDTDVWGKIQRHTQYYTVLLKTQTGELIIHYLIFYIKISRTNCFFVLCLIELLTYD